MFTVQVYQQEKAQRQMLRAFFFYLLGDFFQPPLIFILA